MSEPTPLSAEERYPIEIIQGVEGFCIGLNNYRIAGPKPWGGGTVVKRWDVSLADLGRAIPTIDAQATEIAALRGALEETREQLQHDFAIRCRCDFVTKLPAGIERCVGCRARDRIEAISRVLAGKEAQGA